MVAATVTDGDVRRENESGVGEEEEEEEEGQPEGGDEERFDRQREKGHCWIVRRVGGEEKGMNFHKGGGGGALSEFNKDCQS